MDGIAVEHQGEAKSPRTLPDPPRPGESQEKDGGAMGAVWPMTSDEGGRQDAIGWPRISELNAKLQIPSFEKSRPAERSQRSDVSEETVARGSSEKCDPVGHVAESENMKLLLGGEGAPASRHRGGSAPHFRNLATISERLPEEREIEDLRLRAPQYQGETDKWRKSLPDGQGAVQG